SITKMHATDKDKLISAIGRCQNLRELHIEHYSAAEDTAAACSYLLDMSDLCNSNVLPKLQIIILDQFVAQREYKQLQFQSRPHLQSVCIYNYKREFDMNSFSC